MSGTQGAGRPGDARAEQQDPDVGFAGLIDRLHRETQLWQAFLSIHRQIVERMATQMQAEHNLPLEWFDVLIHLADVPGRRLRQRDLRDRLLLSESGVSRMLVRMASAGLLERTPADDDRRGVEVALTEKGVAALAAATGSHLNLVGELFTGKLSAAETIALRQILTTLDTKAG